MKYKLTSTAVILLIGLSALAFQSSPYARRIRPFAATPSSCQENEIGYNMTTHVLSICKNSGYVSVTTGSSLAITNSAGNNIITKSDGTNLVASRITDDGTNAISINPSQLPAAQLNVGRSGIVTPGIFQVYGTSGDFGIGESVVSIRGETNQGDNDGLVKALAVRALSLAGGDEVDMGDVIGGDFAASAAKNSTAVYSILSNASASNSATVTTLWGLLVGTSISGGATVTNNYGIEVQDISGGTSNWAIKTGTGIVRFGDNLSVAGTTSSTSYLTGSNRVYSNGEPSISGNGTLNTNSRDSSGKVTSTTTGAASIVVTFSTAFQNAPACHANNETTANLTRANSSTTAVTIVGVTVTNDIVSYSCVGY